MANDYVQVANEVGRNAQLLREALPETMKGFAALGGGAYKEGALSPKVKELIALAIGVTVRCEGCVGAHAKSAHQRGASREEVAEAISVAIHMGGGPSMVYGGEALRAYDQFAAKD